MWRTLSPKSCKVEIIPNMTKKIAILGAGICGLALAHFLHKRLGREVDCTIFEAKERVGGWLHTANHNGALFECGPRSLRETSVELAGLIKDIGLDKEVIFTSDDAKKRYIVSCGRLEALPDGLASLFCSKIGRKALLALVREPFCSKSTSDDESVASFFYRRIGRSATDTFVSALCAGIYASCPEELSMRSCFGGLWDKEQQYGSLIKAGLFSKKTPQIHSFSFREGIGVLPATLARGLKATILLNKQVQSVREVGSKVILEADRLYEFDHLYSTITPNAFAKMLPKDDPYTPLLTIPTTSLVTVSVAFKEDVKVPAGFGFLCPRSEDALLLGIVFDSSLFPEQNGGYNTRLSIMFGGTRCPDMVSYSDEVLMAYVKECLLKYLHVSRAPDYHIIMRAPHAISRYPVGHHRTVSLLQKEKRPITLLGSGLYGVSVGDSVTSAYNIAQGY